MKKDPFKIVKNLHVTEKSMVLQSLHESEKNASIRAFKSLKYVFIVDTNANKKEIKDAVEEIYHANKITVTSVNTIRNKQKQRRVRGRIGFKPGFKKAIVTLREGDSIETV